MNGLAGFKTTGDLVAVLGVATGRLVRRPALVEDLSVAIARGEVPAPSGCSMSEFGLVQFTRGTYLAGSLVERWADLTQVLNANRERVGGLLPGPSARVSRHSKGLRRSPPSPATSPCCGWRRIPPAWEEPTCRDIPIRCWIHGEWLHASLLVRPDG